MYEHAAVIRGRYNPNLQRSEKQTKNFYFILIFTSMHFDKFTYLEFAYKLYCSEAPQSD